MGYVRSTSIPYNTNRLACCWQRLFTTYKKNDNFLIIIPIYLHFFYLFWFFLCLQMLLSCWCTYVT